MPSEENPSPNLTSQSTATVSGPTPSPASNQKPGKSPFGTIWAILGGITIIALIIGVFAFLASIDF